MKMCQYQIFSQCWWPSHWLLEVSRPRSGAYIDILSHSYPRRYCKYIKSRKITQLVVFSIRLQNPQFLSIRVVFWILGRQCSLNCSPLERHKRLLWCQIMLSVNVFQNLCDKILYLGPGKLPNSTILLHTAALLSYNNKLSIQINIFPKVKVCLQRI